MLGQVRSLVVILAVPFLALSLFVGSSGADGELLIATVGTNDAFDIALRHGDGSMVAALTPGTYTVRVRDLSRIHNFHIASNEDATVDFRTELEFVGEQDFTVTFRNGTRYVYACEPHWQTMNGSFFVSSPTPPAPPPPKIATLRAAVGPSGRATLSPRTVKAGVARVLVRDRSARHGFRLVGRGVRRSTGTSFTGRKTWRIRLAPGLYRFGTGTKRLSGRLRVL